MLAATLMAMAATDVIAQGSISGTVTSSANGSPLPNTRIDFYDFNGNGDAPSATTTTDATGFYTINLPPSTYGIITQNSLGYINEIYDNVQCSAICDVNALTAIDVGNTAITGINFALEPGGGRIAGTVTSSTTGLPIPNVSILFVDSGVNTLIFSATTDASGNYLSEGGSVTGTVKAVTNSSLPYQNELYDNVKCLDCDWETEGTPIPVTLGVTTSNINFVLDPGGQIAGTVTDVNLAPLASVMVVIHNAAGDTVSETSTDASGNFTTAGLPTGTYYARTENGLGLVDKLWNNIVCPRGFCNMTTSGAVISVTSPSTTSGINFVLSPGGKISGTVTAATGGAPLENIFVGIHNSSNVFVVGAETNSSGLYTTDSLPAGTYHAFVFNSPGWQNQIYNGFACPPTCNILAGTPIVVTEGTTQTGKNFSLSPGGSITGTVTNAVGGAPISNYTVQVWSSAGQFVTATATDGSGVYSISVPPGSYYVRTMSNSQFINQLYNGVTCLNCTVTSSGGTLVPVTVGNTTSNIDFALVTGGRISGTITNAATSAAIQGISAQVFSAAGVNVGSFNTSASGVFTTGGLPAGTYYVRTQNTLGYINKLYAGLPCPGTSCVATTGTPITVTASATTTGINFALSVGGRISGTVTNAVGGAPLQGVTVQAYNAAGQFFGNSTTDASGNYLTFAFQAGTYYIRTSNTLGFQDELYDNLPCVGGCTVTAGTPIAVAAGATTTGKHFALAAGGSVSGTVKDAGTLAGLASVNVQIYGSTGLTVKNAFTNASGDYAVTGLPTGSYFARTFVTGALYYQDELYSEQTCDLSCVVTTGTLIDVTAGATTSGVHFTLTPGGGAITGTVRAAGTLAVLASASVQLYSSTGTFIRNSNTNASGVFTFSGLPAATYYVRTSVSSPPLHYIDELYNNLPCPTTCTVTTGAPVVVVNAATTSGIDFSLEPSLIQNGRFNSGTAGWLQFATPDMSYIVSQVTGGVFEFYRNAPPVGTTNQAVIFQQTGLAAGSGAPLVAAFDLGNSSSVRKRVSVLVYEADFSDLSVCTFWLPANAPLRTYGMRTHTTKAWTNATIAFYAASPGSNGGFYQLDNVSVRYEPAGSPTETLCLDALAPAPPGGADSATLLLNGDFGSAINSGPGWSTFGNINGAVTGGVFEFTKTTSALPTGVLLQTVNQAVAANELLTATFQLGNSSGVRKRVTVILHASDFSDLSACTFWLPPGQPLSTYTYRTYATQAWTGATFSVYPATLGPDQWIRFDNATLKRTPSAAIQGAQCLEPGSSPDGLDVAFSGIETSAFADRRAGADTASDPAATDMPASGDQPDAVDASAIDWITDGFQRTGEPAPGSVDPSWIATSAAARTDTLQLPASLDLTDATSAQLQFQSWLSSVASRARVEVSLDGVTWETVHVVSPSDTWVPVEIDLTGYLGAAVHVRFVFEGVAPTDVSTPDVWRIDQVRPVVDNATTIARDSLRSSDRPALIRRN